MSNPPEDNFDSGENGNSEDSKEKKIISIKNAADYQKMKLDRLFSNFEKPVMIPERPKERNPPRAPDFVRNIMGSSAGAGSGEFHVYRHLRRKEYARQRYIQEKAKQEDLDLEFQTKLEDNKKAFEEKTAKKRAKRLKKKANMKMKMKDDKKSTQGKDEKSDSDSDSGSDEEQMKTSEVK